MGLFSKKEKDNKKEVEYSIFNSEIGKLYCYKLDANNYEEFLTGYKCHMADDKLIFNYCDIGFDILSNEDEQLDIKDVDKNTFVLGIDELVKEYKTQNTAQVYLLTKIEDKIRIRDEGRNK